MAQQEKNPHHLAQKMQELIGMNAKVTLAFAIVNQEMHDHFSYAQE